jgi:lysozyme family protein
MNNSKRAIALILKHEGGFVNNPKDPGGATNKGITIATFRKYIKPLGTVADLKALTDEQATIVYKRRYWDAVLGDQLPSGVDYAVADFAVNSGPSRAAKYLQRVVGATQDGRIGPATLEAVRRMPTAQVINKLCDARLSFMQSIKGGKLWAEFGRGWGRRVADVRKVSLSWAETGQIYPDTPQDAPEPPKPIDLPDNAGMDIPPATGLVAALMRLLAALFGRKAK